MEDIDIDNWDRKSLFNMYLGTDFPYINIGANIDVTHLYNFTKENNLSFYFAMVFVATEVANSIKNFRYRFKDEQPFLIDYNCPIITHLQDGSENFVMVEGTQCSNIFDFCRSTSEKTKNNIKNNGLDCIKNRMDIIHYSCIPWIQYTHFIRTITRDGVDNNPKISWGKYWKEGDRVLMPFSVQVHHGLMDGYHVGKYFQDIQRYLNIKSWL